MTLNCLSTNECRISLKICFVVLLFTTIEPTTVDPHKPDSLWGGEVNGPRPALTIFTIDTFRGNNNLVSITTYGLIYAFINF